MKAAYRTLRQIDSVKLVVIDLDDTLWRGVVAEGVENLGTLEGWPLGFIEALAFLKKRGVLLAIISKNTAEVVENAWDRVVGKLISLDDFAVRKINWDDKVDNMEAVLTETSLLPKSVVFVDDNPIERENMKAAFPEIRILGRHPYFLKRILLWSPETQLPFITHESGRRTELVQQKVRREEARSKMSREDFLRGLNLSITFLQIRSDTHPKFERSLELVNKTNQFNSTGRRWSAEELSEFLRESGEILAFEVSDNFSNYGLVGVLLLKGAIIEQFIMSCRVMGLEVEAAALAHVVTILQKRDNGHVHAKIAETKANFVCREVMKRNGFEVRGSSWPYVGHQRSSPAHIALVAAD